MPDRVLILHSYPPTPCLFGFERGLKLLGYDVTCVGPYAPYGDEEQFRALEPSCRYIDPIQRAPHIADLLSDGYDWVLYLQPNRPFLPHGLLDCPVPVIGFLTEEYKFAQIDEPLYPWFDAAPTAMLHLSHAARRRGHDNRPCLNFIGQQWLWPDVKGEREIPIAFIGHFGVAGITDARDRELTAVWKWCQANGIRFDPMHGVYLRDLINTYRKSEIVWQMSGQGESNLTYRVGEAFAAGAMCLAKRPVSLGGLPAPIAEDEHIVYYDDPADCVAKIQHYLADDRARRRIGEAGAQWLRDNPLDAQVARFVKAVVDPIRDDFKARRAARARAHGLTPARERADWSRYFYAFQDYETTEQIGGW